MTNKYAVIETGGKQYRVRVGQVLDLERLPVTAGQTAELDRVLVAVDDSGTLVGTPTVEGAKVIAEVVSEKKGKKVIIFKYKSKTRYRRKRGHRQIYTSVAIKDIVLPSQATEKAQEETSGSQKRRRKLPKREG